MIDQIKDWGDFLINKILHPFAIFMTPSILLALLIFNVAKSFNYSFRVGFSSLAGAILPLIIMTFLYVFQRDWILILERTKILVGFLVSFICGILIMIGVSFFLTIKSGVPIIEIILSGSFSLLVFSYTIIKDSKVLSYYYGTMCGFLIYIIIWGLPL